MSFGSQFATPQTYCRQGFDRIRSGIILPPGVDTTLYAAFEDGHRAGDPRRQLKLVSAVLGDADWFWPWMEEWAERFIEMKLWPYGWSWLKIDPPLRWHTIPLETRLQMLSTDMSIAAYNELHKSNFLNPDVSAAFSVTLLATPPCEAEAKVAELFRPAIEAGDLSQIPPFFPGDRSFLSGVSKARTARLAAQAAEVFPTKNT